MLVEQDLIPYSVSPLPSGPWLIFAPHPDDETFGMGGSLLLAREHGIPVVIVVLTDGALGGEGNRSDLILRREKEARKVARDLRVSALEFWRLPDRGLRADPQLIEKIGMAVHRYAPRTILFPSPMEYHPDHRVAAYAVWEAAKRWKGNLWSYEITAAGRVNRLIDISPVIDEKRRLMEVYSSQMAENDYAGKILSLNRMRTYTLPAEVRYVEAFFDFSAYLGTAFPGVVKKMLAPFWSREAYEG
ncbi:N-acetylglucosamine malate deacetylase 1 [Methylomarinovum tepidoasis]|uniref:N-acetylglucosamine malate deacetylase 1 n=1 Tax=Methylomarinovum tepidoasis TaxID=2840183 RepID=A0AAU9CNX0_9GAMM|nr:PIG-L deacetylase family protein [Methylomarinovum sp. IN45]BCX87978.1 N-acetylglucosamine malate deacetylase 1 [Methylomarinovum sp. IN45]